MPDPDARIEVEDTRVLEAFRNPTRVRLLRLLRDSYTVKGLAQRLDVPPTRLYHHVNLLDEVGLVEVVETRKVGAMIERVYQRSAGNFTLSERLVSSADDVAELASLGAAIVVDPARVDAEIGLTQHFKQIRDGQPTEFIGDLLREVACLTPEQVEVVREKLAELTELITTMDTETEGGADYGFTFVFFPIGAAR